LPKAIKTNQKPLPTGRERKDKAEASGRSENLMQNGKIAKMHKIFKFS
jgi:hypothetical protein